MDLPEARESSSVSTPAPTPRASNERICGPSNGTSRSATPRGFQRVREAYQLCRSFPVMVAPSEAVPTLVARDVHAQPAGDEASKPVRRRADRARAGRCGRAYTGVACAPSSCAMPSRWLSRRRRPSLALWGDEPQGEPAPAFEHSGDGAPRAPVDVPAPEPPDPEREAERQRTFLVVEQWLEVLEGVERLGPLREALEKDRDDSWRSGSGSSTSYSRSGASTRPSG